MEDTLTPPEALISLRVAASLLSKQSPQKGSGSSQLGVSWKISKNVWNMICELGSQFCSASIHLICIFMCIQVSCSSPICFPRYIFPVFPGSGLAARDVTRGRLAVGPGWRGSSHRRRLRRGAGSSRRRQGEFHLEPEPDHEVPGFR